MINISSLNKNRPKSSNYRYAITECNNTSNNNSTKNKKLNMQIPYIRDKIDKNFFFRDRIKKYPNFSYRNFFISSTPFNFFKNKNNKNEFYACFNGGPRVKININNNLSSNFQIPKAKSFSKALKKPCGCAINNRYFSNNKLKLKKKVDNEFKYRIHTDINDDINNFTNDNMQNEKNNFVNKTENYKNEEICEKSEKYEKKDDDDNFNFFNKKPKRRFHKIQIHNICKPFLVDDYRYYAEKYL